MSGVEAIAAASALDLLAFAPPGWGATLLAGLGNSVLIALGAYGLGFAIGLCGAFGKLYGGPVTKDLLAVYTTIVRAVPELVLILILFYAFTGLLNQALLSWGMDRVQISPIITGIVVLGVVQGAYQTEVLRGGILAVPAGQIEAARAMGMSPFRIARRITLPLAMSSAIPGLANLWLNVTKDTALLAVIGFIELTKATSLAAATTKEFLTFYLAGGALYLLLSMVSVAIFGRIEKWASRGQRHARAGAM
jgi:polar amino acid transport system permease protein